ncbi:MAG: hypothetical protein WBC70_17330 [Candidatus Aminicenantales bacterium]
MSENQGAMYDSIDKAYAENLKSLISSFEENLDTKKGQQGFLWNVLAMETIKANTRVNAYAEDRLASHIELSKHQARGILSEKDIMFDRTVNIDEIAKSLTQDDTFKDAIKQLVIEALRKT